MDKMPLDSVAMVTMRENGVEYMEIIGNLNYGDGILGILGMYKLLQIVVLLQSVVYIFIIFPYVSLYVICIWTSIDSAKKLCPLW